MFGFINRRENISTFISILKSIENSKGEKVINLPISSRFLISFLLQKSDNDLRSRIIHYISEYFSVPLIMNC